MAWQDLHAAPVLVFQRRLLDGAQLVGLLRMGVEVVVELPDRDVGRLPGDLQQRLIRLRVGGQVIRRRFRHELMTTARPLALHSSSGVALWPMGIRAAQEMPPTTPAANIPRRTAVTLRSVTRSLLGLRILTGK
jgi:hypothetical protein